MGKAKRKFKCKVIQFRPVYSVSLDEFDLIGFQEFNRQAYQHMRGMPYKMGIEGGRYVARGLTPLDGEDYFHAQGIMR